jgi:S-adenosylmethionine:tRNA ribosyltransferase-isomerase
LSPRHDLPSARSTTLLLAAAFAGRERLLSAYHRAIHLGYSFYSSGDGMLAL